MRMAVWSFIRSLASITAPLFNRPSYVHILRLHGMRDTIERQECMITGDCYTIKAQNPLSMAGTHTASLRVQHRKLLYKNVTCLIGSILCLRKYTASREN